MCTYFCQVVQLQCIYMMLGTIWVYQSAFIVVEQSLVKPYDSLSHATSRRGCMYMYTHSLKARSEQFLFALVCQVTSLSSLRSPINLDTHVYTNTYTHAPTCTTCTVVRKCTTLQLDLVRGSARTSVQSLLILCVQCISVYNLWCIHVHVCVCTIYIQLYMYTIVCEYVCVYIIIIILCKCND